jgi:ABC-type Fe3+ transport system permease subunit
MATDDAYSSEASDAWTRVGKTLGLVLFGACLLAVVALLLAWGSRLLTGVGLGFWPAVALAGGVLAGLVAANRW